MSLLPPKNSSSHQVSSAASRSVALSVASALSIAHARNGIQRPLYYQSALAGATAAQRATEKPSGGASNFARFSFARERRVSAAVGAFLTADLAAVRGWRVARGQAKFIATLVMATRGITAGTRTSSNFLYSQS